MHSPRKDNRQYITVATKKRRVDASVPAATRDSGEISNYTNSEDEQSVRQGSKPITVLLVDDHTLLREGLRQLFLLEKDIQVVGEAADGLEALQKARHLCPDVVLVDFHLPIVDGITLTRQIACELPDVAVILLTTHQQSQFMLQAIKNGARGYISKKASSHEVAKTIRMVHAQGAAIQPEMTRTLVSEFQRIARLHGSTTIDLLSAKELEILRYVATGMSNREIATKLAYSEKTVKNYLTLIFQKLHLRDRTQAAIFALRQGLLPDEETIC